MKLEEVEIADSWHKRLLGLMFRKKQDKPLVLSLPKESPPFAASIHCCFMRFPIDVLFLNKEKVVVDKALNVRPWTLNVTPRKPVKYIVEFPEGQAKAKPGEKLDW